MTLLEEVVTWAGLGGFKSFVSFPVLCLMLVDQAVSSQLKSSEPSSLHAAMLFDMMVMDSPCGTVNLNKFVPL